MLFKNIFDINVSPSRVGFRETGIDKSDWKRILQRGSIVIKKDYSTNYIKLDETFDQSIGEEIDWTHNHFDVRGIVITKYQDTNPDETHILIRPTVFIGLN